MKDQKLKESKLKFEKFKILTFNNLLSIQGGGHLEKNDPKTSPTTNSPDV